MSHFFHQVKTWQTPVRICLSRKLLNLLSWTYRVQNHLTTHREKDFGIFRKLKHFTANLKTVTVWKNNEVGKCFVFGRKNIPAGGKNEMFEHDIG